MKTKSLLIVAIKASFLFACDFFKNEEVKILNDKLVTARKSGMDLENASMAKQLATAKIEGTVQNVSEKTLNKVVITYKIGRQSVSAEVGTLKPNQKKKFKTSGHKTNQSMPKYSLEAITYKEADSQN